MLYNGYYVLTFPIPGLSMLLFLTTQKSRQPPIAACTSLGKTIPPIKPGPGPFTTVLNYHHYDQ